MWQTLLASKSVLVSLIVSLLLVAGSLVYQESVKRNIPEQQARTRRLLQQIETNDTARTTSPSENTDMDTEGQTEAPIATDDTREMMAEEADGLPIDDAERVDTETDARLLEDTVSEEETADVPVSPH